MFAQVIRARVRDRDALRTEFDRWERELMPGADGFLGSTIGITDDGELVTVARFESEAAARRNSDRPEQGEWWKAVERTLEGDATFDDSTDVQLIRGGGSDEATFAQAMEGRVSDRDRARELMAGFESAAGSWRPDLLGSCRIWLQPDRYLEIAYFTSEAEARAGETADPPEELRALMEQGRELAEVLRYLDLRELVLVSP